MGLRHYVCLAALLFKGCVVYGLNPPHLELKLNNFIEIYGILQPDVEQASEDVHPADDGRCVTVFDEGVTPIKGAVECCKANYGQYMTPPQTDGYCRGSDCTSVFGFPTKHGVTCEEKSCECIECVWDRKNASCFNDPDWHLNAQGEPDMVNGRHCFGRVLCKMNNHGDRPQECNDTRVHALCLENTTAADPWLSGNETGNRTPWKTNFISCGNFLCNVDSDCSEGQYCKVIPGVNPCTSCNYTGQCYDPSPSPSPSIDNGRFSPDCIGCGSQSHSPHCIPCDERLRSRDCNALEWEHAGWNEVDIGYCPDEEDDRWSKLLAVHNCQQPLAGCDTWVCESYIEPAELEGLTVCEPHIIYATGFVDDNPTPYQPPSPFDPL